MCCSAQFFLLYYDPIKDEPVWGKATEGLGTTTSPHHCDGAVGGFSSAPFCPSLLILL